MTRRELRVCEMCRRLYPLGTEGSTPSKCPACAAPWKEPPPMRLDDLADEADYPHICIDCGKPFLGGLKARFCVACKSRRRIEAARKGGMTKRHSAVPAPERRCVVCGSNKVNPGCIRCPDCARKERERREAAKDARWKAGRKVVVQKEAFRGKVRI